MRHLHLTVFLQLFQCSWINATVQRSGSVWEAMQRETYDERKAWGNWVDCDARCKIETNLLSWISVPVASHTSLRAADGPKSFNTITGRGPFLTILTKTSSQNSWPEKRSRRALTRIRHPVVVLCRHILEWKSKLVVSISSSFFLTHSMISV
jgi:hypothetical protein